MRKIPTVFIRDPDDRKHVLPEINPDCEWVLAGEGTATRKYDGTCVLIRRDGLVVKPFVRREVKPGKTPPPGWVEADHDEVTGKRVGWEPAGQSGFAKFIDEVLMSSNLDTWEPGTYELCGPKINGNPEGYERHVLVRHADAQVVPLAYPVDYEGLRERFLNGWPTWEGIVWHHPDGRMAKLKVRDFPTAQNGSDSAGVDL